MADEANRAKNVDLKVAAWLAAACLCVGFAVEWHFNWGWRGGVADFFAMLPWIVPVLVPCLVKRRMKRRWTGFLVAGVCAFLSCVLVWGGEAVIHQTSPHCDAVGLSPWWLVVETLLVSLVLGGLTDVFDSCIALVLKRLGIEHDAHPLFHLFVRAAGVLVAVSASMGVVDFLCKMV